MSCSPVQVLNSGNPATAVLTLQDVKKACKAYKEYSRAERARKEAEDAKKAAAMRVFETLLGIKSEDELRSMSPQDIQRVARRRIKQGLVELDGISPEKLLESIQKSKSERRPSWKDCFINVLGESAATQIQDATDETFSYKFVEAGL